MHPHSRKHVVPKKRKNQQKITGPGRIVNYVRGKFWKITNTAQDTFTECSVPFHEVPRGAVMRGVFLWSGPVVL